MGWVRKVPERKERTCLRCEYFRGIVNGKVRCIRELPAYVSSHSNDRDTCWYWDPDASWKYFEPNIPEKERLQKIRRDNMDDETYRRFTVGCFEFEIGRTNWIDLYTNDFQEAVTITNMDGEDESIMMFTDEWDDFKVAIRIMDEEIERRRKDRTVEDTTELRKVMQDYFAQVISECLKDRKNDSGSENNEKISGPDTGK